MKQKLRWRCRRGMRELDRMLEAFLETAFDRLAEDDKRRFAEILELPDPELHAYLIGRAEPADPELERLLRVIRQSLSV